MLFLYNWDSLLKIGVSYLNQKTVNKPVHFSGVGHTGNLVKVYIKPSSPNTGIIFKRIDLKNNNLIYPNFEM